ncbi:MAG: maltotransferase domain-containing protein [Chloroflexota bacterium]
MMPSNPFAITIERVAPELDSGRFPVKREVGQALEVWADIFAEGHDLLAAVLRYQLEGEQAWRETAMQLVDNDRWRGSFGLEAVGRYWYTLEAYRDVFGSWRQNLEKKFQAGEDVDAELLDGRRLVEEAAVRADAEGRARLAELLLDLDRRPSAKARVGLFLKDDVSRLMSRHPDRSGATTYDRRLEVVVDRERARYAAWYEMFHRSQGAVAGRSATWVDCERRLPDIRRMGFDVLYLPPIHPIGVTGRKGANNAAQAAPSDPGSPWAIGNADGGHKTVNPELGTLDEFDHFVKAAEDHGLEVALDFAIQCSPDHPYVTDHPEWFFHRPDGSIRYAENPPKKYQDIYPLNFFCDDWQALWEELRGVVLFWVHHGVRTFRVDNPHTKPFPFWRWLIAEVKRLHPEVIFLAEAFTRPKVMKLLAKAGFSQSYTYFTWRTEKAELIDYLTELTQTEVRQHLRGNFFTNTPDILPEVLRTGGRPAFKIRLVLAATLSSLYGIYNGFELCEGRGFPGTEDYVDSEKYQYKVWDWDRPGNIKDFIATVNRVRAENPALHEYDNLRFYPSSDASVLFYGKVSPAAANNVLVAVNLDPFQPHQATIDVPLHELGIAGQEPYRVRELLTGESFQWSGSTQTVVLDPRVEPATIFTVQAGRT